MNTFSRSFIRRRLRGHPKVSVRPPAPAADATNAAISRYVLSTLCCLSMLNPSAFPPRLDSSPPRIGASCPNAMAFWKCEANSRPLTFRNFCSVLFERGGGEGGINMDASSSNVALFLRAARRWLRLDVQSLTFLPAHPQIWVSNPPK